MKFIEKLAAAFTNSSDANKSPEEKARDAFAFMTEEKNRRSLRTLDYPEISTEEKEYRGQTVNVINVKTTSQIASYHNLSDDSSRHKWNVATYNENRKHYPDGFFTGSSGGGNSKDYDSFADALTAMQAWDQQQLSTYLQQPAQEGVTRLSRENLKALVDSSFFAQVADKVKTREDLKGLADGSFLAKLADKTPPGADKPKTDGRSFLSKLFSRLAGLETQTSSDIHWAQAAREFGIQLPASAKDADVFAQNNEIRNSSNPGRKPSR